MRDEYLASLKCDSCEDAFSHALPVEDDRNEVIARLVPVGRWALQDGALLRAFCLWRKTFMRCYRVQFNASEDSTREYLQNCSIASPDRIFFAIYLPDDSLVGHLGLSNVSSRKAELDNIIRGAAGGGPQLMYFAEKSLLEWGFGTLGLDLLEAQVLSRNFMAKALHERVGFRTKQSHFLRKTTMAGITRYEICDEAEATESFMLDIIELRKSEFLLQDGT
ncbi:GNAT family N-acetyltransferase [Pseudohaliea sp.]|uniref:GNAT family N-acetyltransferase n=1 Tax=Pseudohaliea sp. TaxID=2740289 RepID=UPI0032EEC459